MQSIAFTLFSFQVDFLVPGSWLAASAPMKATSARQRASLREDVGGLRFPDGLIDLIKPDNHFRRKINGGIETLYLQSPCSVFSLQLDQCVAYTGGQVAIFLLTGQRVENGGRPAHFSRSQKVKQVFIRPFRKDHVLLGKVEPFLLTRRLEEAGEKASGNPRLKEKLVARGILGENVANLVLTRAGHSVQSCCATEDRVQLARKIGLELHQLAHPISRAARHLHPSRCQRSLATSTDNPEILFRFRSAVSRAGIEPASFWISKSQEEVHPALRQVVLPQPIGAEDHPAIEISVVKTGGLRRARTEVAVGQNPALADPTAEARGSIRFPTHLEGSGYLVVVRHAPLGRTDAPVGMLAFQQKSATSIPSLAKLALRRIFHGHLRFERAQVYTVSASPRDRNFMRLSGICSK